MENISAEIREKAHQVCYDYLGGIWQNIPKNEIIIEKLTGGYANLTIKISLPANYKPIKEEPCQAFMKIHCDVLGEGYFRQITENIIAVSLAEKMLAPKVYGIFDGGRLDEYIISRTLVNTDLRNTSIISAIARKLAHLHSMNIPISKDPNKRYNQTKQFVHNAIANSRNNLVHPKARAVKDNFMSINHYEELKWLREIIDSLGSPVIYCHGDLHTNNILLQENSLYDPIVHFVDFDLSGYNYRGVDFASLTTGFCFESPSLEPPYLKCNWGLYPTLVEQKFIFDIYLTEFEKVNGVGLDREKEEKLLLKETKVFSLLSYYYFSSFILQGKVDKFSNPFDEMEIADLLINRYKEVKKEMVLDK